MVHIFVKPHVNPDEVQAQKRAKLSAISKDIIAHTPKNHKPKYIPLIIMTLRGIKYTRDWERVIGMVYFNKISSLYGLRIVFVYKDGYKHRMETDCGIPDPYRHLEHLMAATLTNLQRTFGGYLKLERYNNSSGHIRGFNMEFFRLLETYAIELAK